MTRTTCRECGVRYRVESGSCPQCGAKAAPLWRHAIRWRWQVPLAIGLAVQILASRVSPGEAGSSPAVVAASHFVASTLIFAGLAGLLLYVAERIVQAWRRRLRGRRRAASRE